jgi:photosystem II stability/assembly factor-like uncharacterized protein
MVVQLPTEPEVDPTSADYVEAGVIDDARARHRRERWAGATVAAIAVGIGLLFGLGGGGGGSASPRRHDGGRPPGAAKHVAVQASGVVTHVRSVLEFGLLAPGVGWAATDRSFDLTRDGGARWQVLSQAGKRTLAADVAISGILPDHPLAEDLGAGSSPSARVLAMSFMSRWHAAASCRDRDPGPVGVLALSSDAGRTWATHLLPGCGPGASLSFVNSRLGYAASTPSANHHAGLYRTTDGGAHWRLVSRFRAPMTVSFGNRADGLAFVTPNTASAAAVLYRTTDGGRNWRRLSICGDTPDPTFTVYCGQPISFGRTGVVLAIAQDLSKAHSDHAFLYTTADAGAHWTRHPVPPLDSPQMPEFSAPNAHDIFVYSSNGVLHTSTDGGRSWRSTPEPQFRTMYEMQFINADYGWMASPAGLDYTTDAGRTWKPIGTR